MPVQRKYYRKFEKNVLWVIIVFPIMLIVLFIWSLVVNIENIKGAAYDKPSECENPLLNVKLAVYGLILLAHFTITFLFLKTICKRRKERWVEHRPFFLFIIIGLTISLLIKAVLNKTVSIFYMSEHFDPKVPQGFVAKYIAITFSFCAAELGYIFLWMVLRKPLEFYSKLNVNLWSTEQ